MWGMGPCTSCSSGKQHAAAVFDMSLISFDLRVCGSPDGKEIGSRIHSHSWATHRDEWDYTSDWLELSCAAIAFLALHFLFIFFATAQTLARLLVPTKKLHSVNCLYACINVSCFEAVSVVAVVTPIAGHEQASFYMHLTPRGRAPETQHPPCHNPTHVGLADGRGCCLPGHQPVGKQK
jgi:hypothetical protein